MNNYNFLLTGGAGYIGSHVANLLIDFGHKVTVIDNLITGNIGLVPKRAYLEKIDIGDKNKVSKFLKKKKFDAVLHFAGLIRVDESVLFPKKYYNYNFHKAKVFIEACIENNIDKIIFSSTASVYGDNDKTTFSEEDQLNPINPYADSKMKLEQFLTRKSNQKKIKFLSLRYFNVAGADEKLRTGLVSKEATHLIKIASEVVVGKREKLIINGSDYDTKDGTTIRDYIHVSDLSDIHLKCAVDLIEKGKSGIYNCGYGKGYSVKEVISAINKITSKKLKVEIGPRRDGDSKCVVANISKFKREFSWKPKFNDLNYILKTAIMWKKLLKNKIIKK